MSFITVSLDTGIVTFLSVFLCLPFSSIAYTCIVASPSPVEVTTPCTVEGGSGSLLIDQLTDCPTLTLAAFSPLFLDESG